ncbi:FG-GAP repeat domain-containing protein [Pontibacter cellulosilyticus]|uniref:VCBS repeat-containing protein n=1 Tax=Pontibacter cellulosilyticus TaxID=1720253 RepID=A0A923N688_9BACT|nr:VCBS repeat-containing protein [Pontibacter cellulosilyticus]MBC5993403.1 VCBS repeat-containing protein [Pontibacter cellulosilyticus]
MKKALALLLLTTAVGLADMPAAAQAKKKAAKAVAAQDSVFYVDASANLPEKAVSGPGMDVEAADLNKDGFLDIVIANEYAPNLVMFGDGKGGFRQVPQEQLPFIVLDSEDIAIADLDGDGDLDIVFATEDHTVHELWFNNGSGAFEMRHNLVLNSVSNAVLVKDVNSDGKPDLLFGNAAAKDTPGQNYLYINNGDGTFKNETSQRLPQLLDITQDLKLADIDKDGDDDLLVGNEDGNRVLINDGRGFFKDESASRLPASTAEETRKVTLADVDGDGDLDLYFANVAFRPGKQKQNRLLINNGKGVFTDDTNKRLPVSEEHTMEGAFVDVDGDKDLDLITVDIFKNRPVRAYLNNGKGVFTERTSYILPPNLDLEGIGIKVADFNSDGLKDLYFVNRGAKDRLLLRKKK